MEYACSVQAARRPPAPRPHGPRPRATARTLLGPPPYRTPDGPHTPLSRPDAAALPSYAPTPGGPRPRTVGGVRVRVRVPFLDRLLVAGGLQLARDGERLVAEDALVGDGVAHLAARGRLDGAVDRPVALGCGRAHRLREHATRDGGEVRACVRQRCLQYVESRARQRGRRGRGWNTYVFHRIPNLRQKGTYSV